MRVNVKHLTKYVVTVDDRAGRVSTTSARPTLQLFLVLHSPILKPNLHLSLGKLKLLREIASHRFRYVSIRYVDSLQLRELMLRVRTSLLAWQPPAAAVELMMVMKQQAVGTGSS
jgi:hypothetical protein